MSRDLPAGEVTLLFTDVEGSTRLWELHDERMLPLLAEHERIVADAVDGAGGVLQLARAEGDSSFAVFADPLAAIAAAIDLQRGMSRHPWPADLRIRTRAALHTGAMEVRGDTYYGPVVNRCVRLRSLAHGGQTILSKSTLEAARRTGALPPNAAVADLGTHRLKDLAVPERVYELRHPDLETEFPPLRSPDVERHNLPELLGRFVGRGDERRAVTKALAVDSLVTLVGTGGVGKTRLALEVAWERVHANETNEGTWFVNLTAARSDADVDATLASALGVREQPGRPLIETITDQLGEHAALVVLDNCEHVVTAVRRLVQSVLAACPNVRVLATSREALGVPGERRRILPGLPLLDAVKLFLDRSGLRDPGDAVERVCDRLDGIPLAVERGLADAPMVEAGRTVLEATLAWSYDLLEADEQLLFRRLGVFAGQFTLSGAESVVADELLDVFDVLDLLDALTQRSLVLPTDDGGYRQLFVVRETAARLAREAGEFDGLAARHLAWCLALAQSLRAPDLDERERFDPLRQVGDELLTALDRSFDDELAGVQVQLAGALEEFWYLRGAFSEGRARLEAVLERGAGFRSHRAEVHRSAGYLAKCQGELDAAADHFEASRSLLNEIVRELRETDSAHVALFERHLAETLLQLADTAGLRGEPLAAVALATEALELGGPIANRAALVLGLAEHTAGNAADASRHLAHALREAEEEGDVILVGDCLRNLGVIARARGDLSAAEGYYGRALAAERQSNGEQVLARTLLSLAELRVLSGGSGSDLLDEGLSLAKLLGDRQAEAHGLSTLAALTAPTDVEAAVALHAEALRLRGAIGVPTEVALSQVQLASLKEIVESTDAAIGLAASAVNAFARLGDDRGATEALALLAAMEARRGNTAGGIATLSEALERARAAPTVLERADVLDAAAWLAFRLGRNADARGILDAAARHRRAVGIATPFALAWARAALLGRLGAIAPSTASEEELLAAVVGGGV